MKYFISFLTIILLPLICIPLQAQIISDALILHEFYKFNGNQQLEIGDEGNTIPLEILGRYATMDVDINRADLTAQDLIDTYYKDNPFIGPNGVMKIERTQNSNPNIPVNEVMAMVTGGTATMFDSFAKGLTLFIVDRFKQELSATFFRNFKKKIEKHDDLELLFPQTRVTLGAIDDDIYQFNTYINELRDAFVKDMQSFPTHAESYLITKEKFLEEQPELKFALADAFHITDMLLEEKINIPSLFNYLGKEAYIQGDLISDKVEINRIKGTLTLANEFIISLRENEFSDNWLTRDDIKNIFRYDEALIIYCGLEYQRVKDIPFGHGQKASDFITLENRHKISNAIRKAHVFALHIEEFKNQLNDPATRDSIKTEIQYKLFVSIFDLLETQFEFVNETAQFENKSQEALETYHTIIRVLGEMSFDLKRENYSSAMVNLSKTIELLPIKDNMEIAKVIMKYGTFASEVAEARTPDQARMVIERYAMPVGGSSKKKRSRFDIALNAYMGLSAGQETLFADNVTSTAPIIAVSAPVGVAVSTGIGKGGSFSLFFPIIDVGALATYRLNDNDFNQLPQLSFNNVFAPGGYLVYGIGNDIPLSIGVGAQMGPNLREVSAQSQFNTTEVRGWRWGAFIAVDIPIFSIYNRGK